MTDSQHPQDEVVSNDKEDVWERLYAQPESTLRGMIERDTVYPAVHHIYERKEVNTAAPANSYRYYRLCDNRYWGKGHPRVLEDKPLGTKPISEGFDDLSMLGEGYSCSDCAEAVRELVEMEAGDDAPEEPPETEFDPVRKNDVYLFGITSEAECYVVEAVGDNELLVGEVTINGMHVGMDRGGYMETECHDYEIVDDGDRIDLFYQPEDPPSGGDRG